MKLVKEFIKDLPFALLFLDCIWWVLSLYDIWIFDFWFIGELASHSLVFVVFMAFYAHVHNYCAYSWVAIIGLGLLNILNMIHYFLPLDYLQLYAGLILLSSLLMSVIKWKQAQLFKPY